MSKKKKEQQQQQLQAQQQQQQQQQQRNSGWQAPPMKFRVMNNAFPVPVAPPADFIQLTPIVQPIPIVPYSTQAQPLAQADDYDDYDDGYGDGGY